MEINFTVKENALTRDDSKTVIANSKNYVSAVFEFDEEWEGLSKKAVFEKDGEAYSQLLTDGRCTVPYEVISENGFEVSLMGIDTDSERIVTTSRFRVFVEEGPSLDCLNASEPTLTEMEQIFVIANTVRADADAGVFDGEDGYTPRKGIDYYTEADKAEMVNAVIAALPTTEGVGF